MDTAIKNGSSDNVTVMIVNLGELYKKWHYSGPYSRAKKEESKFKRSPVYRTDDSHPIHFDPSYFDDERIFEEAPMENDKTQDPEPQVHLAHNPPKRKSQPAQQILSDLPVTNEFDCMMKLPSTPKTVHK